MSLEVADLLTPGAITTGGGGALLFVRWVVTQWATVKREGVEAARIDAAKREAFEAAEAAQRRAFEAAAAAAARADNDRMVNALIEQARSNAALVGELAKSNAILGSKLDGVSGKLDQLVEREFTPVEGFKRVDPPSERRRARTPAQQQPGWRSPRPGTHSDDDT